MTRTRSPIGRVSIPMISMSITCITGVTLALRPPRFGSSQITTAPFSGCSATTKPSMRMTAIEPQSGKSPTLMALITSNRTWASAHTTEVMIPQSIARPLETRVIEAIAVPVAWCTVVTLTIHTLRKQQFTGQWIMKLAI